MGCAYSLWIEDTSTRAPEASFFRESYFFNREMTTNSMFHGKGHKKSPEDFGALKHFFS
jgi:hypothetical protein